RVNNVDVPQDAYRKQLAFNAQTAWNRLQDELKQFNALSGQSDTASTTKHQALQAEIRADEGNFGQSTITQNTIDQLIEDQLIQQGIRKYFPQDVAKLQPTSQAVGDQLKTFKEGFPAGETYADFLSKNSLSESDVRTAIALKLRRDLMQQYLA